MTKVTRTKKEDYDVYIAEDGTEFTNERDCKYHDDRKGLQQVWIITEHAHERGQNVIGIFSSEEKANIWLDGLLTQYRRNFSLNSDYLDNRIFAS